MTYSKNNRPGMINRNFMQVNVIQKPNSRYPIDRLNSGSLYFPVANAADDPFIVDWQLSGVENRGMK